MPGVLRLVVEREDERRRIVLVAAFRSTGLSGTNTAQCDFPNCGDIPQPVCGFPSIAAATGNWSCEKSATGLRQLDPVLRATSVAEGHVELRQREVAVRRGAGAAGGSGRPPSPPAESR